MRSSPQEGQENGLSKARGRWKVDESNFLLTSIIQNTGPGLAPRQMRNPTAIRRAQVTQLSKLAFCSKHPASHQPHPAGEPWQRATFRGYLERSSWMDVTNQPKPYSHMVTHLLNFSDDVLS